jgi:hypothetical protein
MNIRRLQGWALVLSAVINLLGFFSFDSGVVTIVRLIGVVLFIFGLPAINSVQPMGSTGLIGVLMVMLAALIALVANVTGMLGNSINPSFFLVSAIVGTLGRIIVGWLTTREKVFSSWAGWAFIIEGLFNFVGGTFAIGALSSIFNIVILFAGSAAQAGYGMGIIKHQS